TLAAWPKRLRELERAVRGLGERARALAEGGGDAAAWADVALATIASHGRDLDALAPWIEGLDDIRLARWADRQTAGAVARLIQAPPSLERLPERARPAARALARVPDRDPG